MFIAAYHFDGDPSELTARFERLMAGFPQELLLLNVCVTHAKGMTVYDACPSEADFRGFSTSAELAAAFAGVGLATPRVEPLGEVHHLLAPVVTRT